MRADFVTADNMAMLTDLYELTMAASYLKHRPQDEATFDLFVRKLPPQRSYLVFAGLEQALFYLSHLRFGPESLRYLKSTRLFPDAFLTHLKTFRFRGEVWAMPEGTVCFPNEPVLRVSGNIIEAQVVETYLLNAVNLQSVIATKASRVVDAAQGRRVVEFGLRRTQGADAGLKVARAAYLAGCAGTSNVLAGEQYGVPIFGTMAHSYVQSYATELESFRAFADTFPRGTTLLIDTYDNEDGARHAAIVAKELLRCGHHLGGVRLDSGDLVELSRRVRRILDREGLQEVQIFASGNLSEYRIEEILKARAPIDAFGVGTEMSVSSDAPSLDVVYKMSEVVRGGRRYPTLKLSTRKQTYPGRKQVYRVLRPGRGPADMLGLQGERLAGRPLLRPVMRGGRLVRPLPSLQGIRRYAARQRALLPPRWRQVEAITPPAVAISPALRRAVQDFRRRILGLGSERAEAGDRPVRRSRR